MCGIVGFFGEKNAREVIMSGLHKLEYRGYDSAGVALLLNDNIDIFKTKGRVSDLEKLVSGFDCRYGIGHTRWATHGEPNYVNSHPHQSQSKRFVVVHNGVIENSLELKLNELSSYTFNSQTDTEVIANLIERFSENMSVEKAIRKTISYLEGSYALIILDIYDKTSMYIAKNRTPLLVGIASNGVTVASDIIALAGWSDYYYSLEDKTFGIINSKEIKLFDNGIYS